MNSKKKTKLLSQLKHFKYCQALGGHANDVDSLEIGISYHKQSDLIEILKSLDITVTKYTMEPAKAEIGKTYTAEQAIGFPAIIPNTKWIKQPGHQTIEDVPVFIYCSKNVVEISVNASEGNGYTYILKDLENTLVLENYLLTHEANFSFTKTHKQTILNLN